MAYEIKVDLIPGLPKIPYDGGVNAYVGVIGHSTANYGDSDVMERNFEAGNFKDSFVHFFVDDTGIMQVADTNYLAYGACHTGNHKGYVQVELCQSHDHAKFLKAYDAYCYILALNLYKKKLGVVDNVTLRSHKQISDAYNESDHQDPVAYLAEHGKTWANVVADVKAKYAEMEAADKPKVAPAADVFYKLYVDGKQVGAYKVGENAMADGWKMYNAGQKTVIMLTPDKSKYTFDLHPDQNLNKPTGIILKGNSVATVEPVKTDSGVSAPNTVNKPVLVKPVVVDIPATENVNNAEVKGLRAFLQMLVKLITDFLNK